MSLRARSSGVARLLTVVIGMLAVLALAVPPAFAESGHLRAGRSMALSGDRTYLRTNMAFNNVAPGGEMGITLGFGNSYDVVGMRLIQDGSTMTSRRVFSYTYGEHFVNVSGLGCTSGSFTECDRKGFDWLAGRSYQVVVERGGKSSDGWLWSMSITDLETKKRVPLLTLRSPYGQLSATAGAATLDLSPNNCENINAAAGVITKPRRKDSSTFGWGAKTGWQEGCSGSTVAAPVVNGNLKPRITQ